MLVPIRLFRDRFEKMHMLSFAYRYGRAGLSTEFMEMLISSIGAEFHFMDMAVPLLYDFVGNGAETVVMAFAALCKKSGAPGKLVNMLLFLPFIAI